MRGRRQGYVARWDYAYRAPRYVEKRKVEGKIGMDTDKDVYHTLEATLGVKAIRDKNGTIIDVSATKAWKDRPEFVPKDIRLLRLSIEVPESFFGFESHVKGKIESKLVEEFDALVEELS